MTSELPLTSSIIEASFMKWSRGRGNSELVLMRMWNVWMEPAKGEELVIKTVEADEFLVAVSPEDVVAKEMVVREEDGPRGSAEERSGETGDEHHELLFERWKMNILGNS
ncbi:hypothetical protein HID58_081917 [Brassica napus]|uniref:Uncharacterized protein n=1 Tax=Brassica napus TaxID=3708 RepID=A0ABQ7Y941_BRANA|nr:hypothetical protein HID58_081917 [Brassica napus]